MFEQFIIVHFSGLVLWKNKDGFERDTVDKLISQILLENRQIEQGIEIGSQRYYHLVVRDMKLFFIASHPKVTQYMAAGDIMRGLAQSFMNNYGAPARAVEIDLDLDAFQGFSKTYQTDIGSLVTTGRLSSATSAPVVQTEKVETTQADGTNQGQNDSPDQKDANENVEANNDDNSEGPANLDGTQGMAPIGLSTGPSTASTESVEERMKQLKAKMRASAAKKTQTLNAQLRSAQNAPPSQPALPKQKVQAAQSEELQYSVSHGTSASNLGLSGAQNDANSVISLQETDKSMKQQSSKWTGFFGKAESEEATQSFWSGWSGSDGIQKLKTRLKQKLLDANVSLEVVQALLGDEDGNQGAIFDESVGSGLGARREVKKRLKSAIERILVNGNLSVLQGAEERRRQRQAGEATRPYVLAVVGVNGMGKTTTVAKLVYRFQAAGLRVFCCACDSYRSGAVEQLAEHCRRLNCGLFEQGYGRNGAAVARHGIVKATQENYDVVLLDTAGRMHNNGALMQELAGLIRESEPDNILFIAEALIGAGGTEQLRDFNGVLTSQAGRGIDGIILTKFDAVGGRVGAALNLCYASGLPIAFLGVGQGYTDIVEVDVQDIVDTLV